MKTFAIYDKDGVIKKVISTTRSNVVGKNLSKAEAENLQYIKVTSDVRAGIHQIVNGRVVKQVVAVKPRFSIRPNVMIDPKSVVTEKDIDDCKDIDGLKVLLKKMIGPKTISFGKGV
jgi:hypothetical protein